MVLTKSCLIVTEKVRIIRYGAGNGGIRRNRTAPNIDDRKFKSYVSKSIKGMESPKPPTTADDSYRAKACGRVSDITRREAGFIVPSRSQ